MLGPGGHVGLLYGMLEYRSPCWTPDRHVGLLIVMLDSCSTAERSQTPFWVSVVKLHPGSTVQHGDHESSMAPSSSNCEQRPEHGELAPTWRPETPTLQPGHWDPDQNGDNRPLPPPCWGSGRHFGCQSPCWVPVAMLVAAAMVWWVHPPLKYHNFIRFPARRNMGGLPSGANFKVPWRP